MSLQFSRSLRSLSSDSYRVARIGMVLAIVAVAALIVWFFFASVTLFAQSTSLRLTDTGRVLVTFPKEVIQQIKPGQAAVLRLTSNSDEKPVVIQTVVFSVDNPKNQAEILPVSEDIPPEISPGALQGNISVEVAYITPVSLVLRTAGYGVDQRKVPVSPQSTQESNP